MFSIIHLALTEQKFNYKAINEMYYAKTYFIQILTNRTVYRLFTARVRSTMGGYVFSLSTNQGGGGGLPHLHPIILPLVPCPFWRGTPATGPRPFPGGTPVLGRMGYPPGQVRMGYHPAKTGWDTPSQDGVPPARMRYPLPRDRLCLDRLCRRRYVSCGFPQEDCLVQFFFNFSHLLFGLAT